MPNMPLFSLQVVPAQTSTVNGLAQAGAQKNTATQALTSNIEPDHAEQGTGGSPSFSQALNEQLHSPLLPLLPVGQEFAALVSPKGPQQLNINEQALNNSELAVHTEHLLGPLMNNPETSLPLELHDLQRQRNLDVKWVPTAPVEKSPSGQINAQAAKIAEPIPQPGHLSTGQGERQGQPLAPLSPLPIMPEPIQTAAQAVVSSEVLSAQAVVMPAISPKMLTVNEALTDEVNPLASLLSAAEDSELSNQSLHEKPITLTTKTTLLSEPVTPLAQLTVPTMLSEHAVLQNSDGSWQASSPLSKELHTEIDAAKAPLSNAQTQAQFKLDVPPQSPQWGEQIAKRISIMSTQDVQTARIQLDPPEMGALEVKIKMQNDHISVSFTSGNQQVREALEAQSPRLRELLEQQGVNLTDVNVSDQSKQQTGGQAEGEQAGQGEHAANASEQEIDEVRSVELHSDSLVDYFA